MIAKPIADERRTGSTCLVQNRQGRRKDEYIQRNRCVFLSTGLKTVPHDAGGLERDMIVAKPRNLD